MITYQSPQSVMSSTRFCASKKFEILQLVGDEG